LLPGQDELVGLGFFTSFRMTKQSWFSTIKVLLSDEQAIRILGALCVLGVLVVESYL